MPPTRALTLCLVCTLLWSRSPAILAQTDDIDLAAPAFNYAFATQLGSGVYIADGRSVQIYRISGVFALRKGGLRDWSLYLRLPLTFGFYNFKVEDVFYSGVPDKLGTIALIPTLEFELKAGNNWWIGPFWGAGVGKDFSGGEFNYIYATGLHSIVKFPQKHFDVRLGNRLVYTGYTNKNMNFADDLAFLESGVDLRRPLGIALGKHSLAGSVFLANYLYFISPHIIRFAPDPIEMQTGWEIGITLGTVDPWKVIGIRLPRIGISYRFGTGKDALRVIIGNPFPVDTPEDRGVGMK